jgi:hypothetical protein
LENTRSTIVTNETRLLEEDGSGVDNVGTLLNEERIVGLAARVEGVSRRVAKSERKGITH